MSFDFQTLADAIDYGFGTGFRPDYTVMAGAQLHVKTAPLHYRRADQVFSEWSVWLDRLR